MRRLHLWTAIGIAGFGLVLGWTDIAAAESAVAPARDPNTPELEAVAAIESNPFGRGRRTFSLAAAGSVGEDQTSLQRVTLAARHHVLDDLSLGLAGSLASARIDEGDDGVGAGLQVMVRWHALRRSDWSGFVELGSGPLWLTEDYPARTSRFNFASEAGIGFTRRLSSGRRLIGGVRAMHISNAGLDDHNPGHNSVVFYLGMLTTE